MDTLLTRTELAREIGLPEGTINRLRRSGRIPAVQLSPRIFRFVLADVYAAIREGALKAPPEPKKEPDEPKRKRQQKPTITAELLHEHIELPPHMRSPEARMAVLAWLDYKRKTGKPYKSMSFVALLFEKFPTAQEFIAAVKHSIANNYQGLFAPNSTGSRAARANTNAQANLDLIEKLRREEQPLEVYENE